MVDGCFRDFEAAGFGQGCEEAVAAAEVGGVAEDFGFEELERAARVANGIRADHSAEGVGYFRAEATPPVVLAVGAVAADHVVVAKFVEELGDVSGVVLQVCVEGGDEFAMGKADASYHGF